MDWKTFEHCLSLSLQSMPEMKQKPGIMVILGSGLSRVMEDWELLQTIGFEEILHHPKSGVVGHPGRYEIRLVEGVPVVFSLGRVHLYEGYSALEVVYGLALWARLGVKNVIITNAAGGIGEYEVGSVVAITDHINHQGTSPLVGCPYPERFVSMIEAYDRATWEFLQREGIPVGVYAGVLGPQYESPAEIRALSREGATLVGMSTVQETIMSRYLGLRVCALSVVTNRAAGLGDHKPDHQAVLRVASQAEQRLKGCLLSVVRVWGKE